MQCRTVCRKKLACFFLAEGDGLYWFLNLCASVKICVQKLLYACIHERLDELALEKKKGHKKRRH